MKPKYLLPTTQTHYVASEKVLDTNVLLERCEQSIETADRLIEEFLGANESDLPELERALSVGDVAKVASMAYRIGKSAAQLGALQTRQITMELEKCCRRGQCETLPLHLSQFKLNQKELRLVAHEVLGSSRPSESVR